MKGIVMDNNHKLNKKSIEAIYDKADKWEAEGKKRF